MYERATIDVIYDKYNEKEIGKNPFEPKEYLEELDKLYNIIDDEDIFFDNVIEVISLARRTAFEVGFAVAMQLNKECVL